MKEQYIKNLELKHNKKLRKELSDSVSEETLNSPEFAKHARAKFLRKRLIDLSQQASDFELQGLKDGTKDIPDKKWLPTALRFVKTDKVLVKILKSLENQQQLKQIQKEISKVIREYEYLFSTDIKEKISDTDIENAKQYPIQDILGETQDGKFTCIFHSPDNNPSLHYYEKTNSVHCFSCGEGGDSIAVYMQVNNVDFIEAVKQLKELI